MRVRVTYSGTPDETINRQIIGAMKSIGAHLVGLTHPDVNDGQGDIVFDLPVGQTQNEKGDPNGNSQRKTG